MSTGRFVVLGLAHTRTEWFPEVARWSTTGHLPMEFLKCVSVEDLRARATSGRRFSAALLDGRLPAVDRDLIGTLADAGLPSLVVGSPTDSRDWLALGAAGSLTTPLDRDRLRDALELNAEPVAALDHDGAPSTPAGPRSSTGRLITVTGRAGVGRSTVACAVAQHLVDAHRGGRDVMLVDLARRAHHALLHDAGDVVPGIQELVEACRSASADEPDPLRFSFAVPQRGYRVVLGLRRPRDWVTIRSRAFDVALTALCRGVVDVVADVDDDVEGEAQTGSFDIEDRNLMARATLARADLVLLVATATVTGVHGLVDGLQTLREFGLEGQRTLVVVNRGPRSGRAKAELTRTIADLVGGAGPGAPYVGPVFVPDRRDIDLIHRDRARFPTAVTGPAGRAVETLLARNPPRSWDEPDLEPVPVRPGSLGSWGAGHEAAE